MAEQIDPLASAAAPVASGMTAGWKPTPPPTAPAAAPAAAPDADDEYTGDPAEETTETADPPAEAAESTETPADAAQEEEPEAPPAPPPTTRRPGRFALSPETVKLGQKYEALRAKIEAKIDDNTYSVVDDGADQARLTLLHQQLTSQIQAERDAHADRILEAKEVDGKWQKFLKDFPHTTREKATKIYNEQLAKLKEKHGDDQRFTPASFHLAALDRMERIVEGQKGQAAPATAPPATGKKKPAAPKVPDKKPPTQFMPQSQSRRTAAPPEDPLDAFAASASDEDILSEFGG